MYATSLIILCIKILRQVKKLIRKRCYWNKFIYIYNNCRR